jgi:hypothetical protein
MTNELGKNGKVQKKKFLTLILLEVVVVVKREKNSKFQRKFD